MIRGKKVVLRPIEEEDLPVLVQWINDPEISHLVGGWSFPVSYAEQKEWFSRSHADKTTQRWVIENEEEKIIGMTGLWQINYHDRNALTACKLGTADVRGKGYGTDAIMTVMSYAFYQVGLHRLWTEILSYNVTSYRVYVEKCGWKVEGIYRQHVFRDGVFHDQYSVAILKEDFDRLAEAKDYLPALDSRKIEVSPQHWALKEEK